VVGPDGSLVYSSQIPQSTVVTLAPFSSEKRKHLTALIEASMEDENVMTIILDVLKRKGHVESGEDVELDIDSLDDRTCYELWDLLKGGDSANQNEAEFLEGET
jgi:hypothetical protein